MEEAVLGAVLLETSAIEAVITVLKADHFYKEKHKEIWLAIVALYTDKEPVNMRSLVNHLRKSGKLELVDGTYYIAELTSKVSSTANLEYDARVIIEMSVKRELIQIGSRIQFGAYEDSSDVFKFLESSIQQLADLHADVTKTSGPERIQALWTETLITEEPPEQPPLLLINDSIIATPGNHSLLVGKKKSRKTLYIVYLIAKYLVDNPDKASSVLLFDTEQGRRHVYKLRHKIHLLTGLFVPVFYLRGQSPKDRRDFIHDTVQHWADRPTLIIIDGIRDLMSNINDPDETTEVITWLEQITLQHNVHVMNVLHLNKTDGNARGHIGSELLNKAEVTTELERDEKSGVTIVKCESSREKPFENFAFTHGANDLPELVGVPLQGNVMPSDEKLTRVQIIWSDGPLRYQDAIDSIKANFACGINKAGQLLAEFQRLAWVIKSGPARNPDTVYKLMVTQNGAVLSPLKDPIAPPELPFQRNFNDSNNNDPDELPF